jgi:hypothetical protein
MIEFLSQSPPNYFSVQCFDDVCNVLLLLMSQTTYCGLKFMKCQRFQHKMNQANAEPQKVLNER